MDLIRDSKIYKWVTKCTQAVVDIPKCYEEVEEEDLLQITNKQVVYSLVTDTHTAVIVFMAHNSQQASENISEHLEKTLFIYDLRTGLGLLQCMQGNLASMN